MTNLTFILRLLKRRCYGNQLIFAGMLFFKRRNWPPSVFSFPKQNAVLPCLCKH